MLQDKYPGVFGFRSVVCVSTSSSVCAKNCSNNCQLCGLNNSVSHTTRKPRPKEKDGVDYNFTTVEAIKKDIADNKFIEVSEAI